MAMTVNGLKAAIITQLGTAEDSAKQDAFATAIATAVVTYIQANAAVPVIPVQVNTGTGTGATTAPGTVI